MTAPEVTDGVIVIDKPQGCTSHDVVARVRRIVGTRKVGHAGTLDPMATGVLVVGIRRATRLLGYLAASDKEYLATMRLGVTTTTDDAEGEVVRAADPAGVTDEAVRAALQGLSGDIQQVPSTVSALKVDGVRAYQRARAGETVDLSPRPVRIEAFDLLARRDAEVEVRVVCSAGTYVRALARDVGAALGVGAHLSALRRTRSGGFVAEHAQVLTETTSALTVLPLPEVVGATFPRVDVDDDTARRLGFGQRLELAGVAGVTGVFGPDGSVVSLVEPREDGTVRTLVGFTG